MAMKFDEIKKELEKRLKKSRYEHVVRVADTAVKINERHNLGLDENKVKCAAILHDCAKHLEEEYFELFKDKYNLKKDEVFEEFAIAHAILGVYAAKEIYGIQDKEILDAIRWHTTGRENMSTLEKVVCIADYVEPGRDFETVEIVRKALEKDLDLGLIESFNQTTKYLIDKNAIINIETIKARNYLQRRVNE